VPDLVDLAGTAEEGPRVGVAGGNTKSCRWSIEGRRLRRRETRRPLLAAAAVRCCVWEMPWLRVALSIVMRYVGQQTSPSGLSVASRADWHAYTRPTVALQLYML
jgi:hypothetical protein